MTATTYYVLCESGESIVGYWLTATDASRHAHRECERTGYLHRVMDSTGFAISWHRADVIAAAREYERARLAAQVSP
ncbi:MAG: hypothetical protein AB7F22_25585 [Reyranella sp.]|uniref:hypothetical protein n=1 Tax=Reyranella sp. TaxID=1929291 RepID=UPI003D0D6CFE